MKCEVLPIEFQLLVKAPNPVSHVSQSHFIQFFQPLTFCRINGEVWFETLTLLWPTHPSVSPPELPPSRGQASNLIGVHFYHCIAVSVGGHSPPLHISVTAGIYWRQLPSKESAESEWSQCGVMSYYVFRIGCLLFIYLFYQFPFSICFNEHSCWLKTCQVSGCRTVCAFDLITTHPSLPSCP